MKMLIIATVAATLSTAAFAGNFDGTKSAADFAAQHFAQSHSEGDGPRGVPSLTNDGEVISTKGSSLAAFAAEKLFNGRDDER